MYINFIYYIFLTYTQSGSTESSDSESSDSDDDKVLERGRKRLRDVLHKRQHRSPSEKKRRYVAGVFKLLTSLIKCISF